MAEARLILTKRFDEALAYAVHLHRDQLRKGKPTPYAGHLLGVCALVIEDEGASEDEAIAALLHDAIEDQGNKTSLEEIQARFGERVAEIVAGCTDSWTEPKPPWHERKRTYVAAIRHKPPHVRRVSAADKLYNARAILDDYRRVGEALWSRFTGGRDGTLWYYRALANELRAAGGGPIVDELERVVAEIELQAKAAGAAST
jgi:(p)ppGpp synthase/HD superfamily hydrolase